MKKTLVNIFRLTAVSVLAFLATSCASTQLYGWYNYQNDYYQYQKNADASSLATLTKTYEKIIEKKKGVRGTVPPGIYADYGWILLEAGKTEEGKAMLMKEVELYPESEVFIGTILKRFEK